MKYLLIVTLVKALFCSKLAARPRLYIQTAPLQDYYYGSFSWRNKLLTSKNNNAQYFHHRIGNVATFFGSKTENENFLDENNNLRKTFEKNNNISSSKSNNQLQETTLTLKTVGTSNSARSEYLRTTKEEITSWQQELNQLTEDYFDNNNYNKVNQNLYCYDDARSSTVDNNYYATTIAASSRRDALAKPPFDDAATTATTIIKTAMLLILAESSNGEYTQALVAPQNDLLSMLFLLNNNDSFFPNISVMKFNETYKFLELSEKEITYRLLQRSEITTVALLTYDVVQQSSTNKAVKAIGPKIPRNGLSKLLNSIKAVGDTQSKRINVVANCKTKEAVEENSNMFSFAQNLINSVVQVNSGEGAHYDGNDVYLSDEIELLCKQRGLDYAILKTPNIIIPKKQTNNIKGEMPINYYYPSSSSHGSESTSILIYPNLPSLKSSPSWPRKLSLLSSFVVPIFIQLVCSPPVNATFTIANSADDLFINSFKSNNGLASNVSFINAIVARDWKDQYLKLFGPEIERISLHYLGPSEIEKLLHNKFCSLLQKKQIGLVTPYKVELLPNGLRIVFIIPSESSFEKQKLKNDERSTNNGMNNIGKIQNEEEALTKTRFATFGKNYQSGGGNKEGNNTISSSSKNDDGGRNKSNFKSDGGLDIIVENTPYVRVRVVRSQMKPGVLVKVESEQILLRAIKEFLNEAERAYFEVINQF